MAITKKQIEDYYYQEWYDLVSTSTINLLIDLTCQDYHMTNQPHNQSYIKTGTAKPLNLGKI